MMEDQGMKSHWLSAYPTKTPQSQTLISVGDNFYGHILGRPRDLFPNSADLVSDRAATLTV